ncbi:hypothetical protein, partial [Stenotrophomonas sp. M37]|uniref:hypothetical protein n=1 Tax=Stenotrophomonas sp. M37 TaxID=2662206 RepID=UPI001C129C0A
PCSTAVGPAPTKVGIYLEMSCGISFRLRRASGLCLPWSAPFGEAATGSAIGVPSTLGTYRKCRLQGRHFRSGQAGTATTLRVIA